ncbi:MAG: galactose-1-phosphate uridylyltransferase [Pseudomonadota bacterium]
MSDETSKTLAYTVRGAPVYRREHIKPDGRSIYFYGYDRHTDPVIEGENLEQVTGSELRRHPLRGDWAVYAANRQNRTFKPSAAADPLAPSRPGEPLTEIPFETFELCVFENRFPSFFGNAPAPAPSDLDTARAQGACEVIVYAPESTGSLASLGQARRRLVVAAWVDRYNALRQQGAAFVMPFENRGDEVGVTLHHPHGQIYAFPVVPGPQLEAAKAFAAGYDLSGQLAGWAPDYHINSAGSLVSFAPPFARFPYEVWIAGRRSVPGPWAYNEEEADGFAHLLGDTIARYDAFFGRPTPYMLTLHAAPAGTEETFQFTAQFYPLLRAPERVKYLASVEQATGLFTVDILPEQAAKALRDIDHDLA